MPIIRGKEFAITKNLTEAEKSLGVDLQVNKDGDLQLNNLGDFELVAGAKNAAQAVRLKLLIERGGLVYHPALGTDLQIGEKTKDAFSIRAQIINSLNQDSRFENVDAKVTVEGSVIFVEIRVALKNTGIQVPLKFVAVNQ